MSINFRTTDNDVQTLKAIQNIQLNNISNIELHENNDINEQIDTMEYEIHNEKGAAFIYLKTNLTDRPIKLLVDTGASVSILADDMITNSIEVMN